MLLAHQAFVFTHIHTHTHTHTHVVFFVVNTNTYA